MASQTKDSTQDIETKYIEFRKACKELLPKIDRKLVADFLHRKLDDPGGRSMYSIDVITKAGLDTQEIKDLVWREIGQVPDVDDHGTHYRIEHKLTLEGLKRLSDFEFVVDVKGSYIGTDFI